MDGWTHHGRQRFEERYGDGFDPETVRSIPERIRARAVGADMTHLLREPDSRPLMFVTVRVYQDRPSRMVQVRLIWDWLQGCVVTCLPRDQPFNPKWKALPSVLV